MAISIRSIVGIGYRICICEVNYCAQNNGNQEYQNRLYHHLELDDPSIYALGKAVCSDCGRL